MEISDFVFTNHEFESGIELFNEIGYYTSDSFRLISAGSFKGGIFNIPSNYYWFSQLPESIGFYFRFFFRIDGWRPYNLNREISVDKPAQDLLLV